MELVELDAQVEKHLHRQITDLDRTQRIFMLNAARRRLMRGPSLRCLQASITPVILGTTYTDDWALPTDYLRRYLLNVYTATGVPVTTGEDPGLVYMTREQQFALYPDDTAVGTPTKYTVWAGKIVLRPRLDTDYLFKLDYFKRLPDLTLSGSTSDDLTVIAPDLLVWDAVRIGFSLLGEDGQAALYAGMYNEALREFRRDNCAEKMSGRSLIMGVKG